MARSARKRSESGIYHVVTRGNNKQDIFLDDDDRQQYYMVLAQAKQNSDFSLYAYCFMDNHVHLLIKENLESVSEVMRRIGSSYVYRFNLKHERVGYLFQDRYKSEPVLDDGYFITVLRYIHKNPVKAGLVEKAGDYIWSSYRDYLSGRGITDQLFALKLFSQNRVKAVQLFQDYHQQSNDDRCLDIELIDKLSENEALGAILEAFQVESIEELTNLDNKRKREALKILKSNYKLSIRQIEKLTGINRGIITRA
jgi:putative transposase